MTSTAESWPFQKASKNAPSNYHKINGRIATIRPFHKVCVRKQVRNVQVGIYS